MRSLLDEALKENCRKNAINNPLAFDKDGLDCISSTPERSVSQRYR